MNVSSADENKKCEEDKRPACRYWRNCYQKNAGHRRKFRHPSPDLQNDNKVSEPATKKKKIQRDEDSTVKDTPQTKKQSASTEEIQKTVKVENSIVEKTDKDSNSNNEKTEKCLDSSKEQINAIVKTPKVEPSPPNADVSSNNSIEDDNDEDLHSESAKLIRQIFLVNMPQDFYKFYDFCTEIKSSDPTTALKIADLKLVGPYDVLSGEITAKTPNQEKLLVHWRYYYDPPEFQTIVKGNDREGLHFGYWRDRPSSDPVFVATNCSNVSHKIKPLAENIFGATVAYIEERAKKANPFEKTSFFNLLGKLKAYTKKHNISLETLSAKMKSREKNVVARTIHGAGIVCPYNKKTQVGYRELSVTDNQLLKIVKKIEDAKDDIERASPRAELSEVIRLATIAGDECDFGTCLELGHDLLSTGCAHVQNAALAVLSIAYSQLERTEFLTIVEAHMKDRKKSSNCSALQSRKSIESLS
ncbi:histone PARylation factor 1 [Phymastichus coffea]|uniref:histone PARylation factor 1 n=1 Tax=Phymastichus coffea TaxID=108790 RepID=UPI00273A87DA|nr:histone PARylation factor 1 [Phymastichus coffea]